MRQRTDSVKQYSIGASPCPQHYLRYGCKADLIALALQPSFSYIDVSQMRKSTHLCLEGARRKMSSLD